MPVLMFWQWWFGCVAGLMCAGALPRRPRM